MRLLFLSVVILLFAQGITASVCEFFNICSKTTTSVPVVSASASVLPSSSSSIVAPTTIASSSIAAPTSSATSTSITVSSAAPSSTSSLAPTTLPSSTPSSTFIPTSTTSLLTTTSASATPSATETQAAESGGSNIGVIVGSVCGFIAIIGAGFAYAFFSKTRRNNRDKRLHSQSDDVYTGKNGYQQDPYSRPSPAIAASAVAAAENIHSHNQWNNNPSYNYAPQTPMVAVGKQHDPYYSTAPVSQMAYPTSDPYYNNNQQQYYDPNAAYYDQQHHYDPHYVDSQKQQYDPYAQQHKSPVLINNNSPIITGSNVYSAPHSYSNEPNSTVNHR